MDQEKQKYGIARARTNRRSMGLHCPKLTPKFEEASHTFFYAEPFSKGDLKSKKGNQTIHCQSTTQTKTSIIRIVLACNQLCSRVTVCDWFDQYNRNQETHRREGLELPTEDLTNLAHRKDLTASGNWMRHCGASTEGKT